jgi:hypothetical protein
MATHEQIEALETELLNWVEGRRSNRNFFDVTADCAPIFIEIADQLRIQALSSTILALVARQRLSRELGEEPE